MATTTIFSLMRSEINSETGDVRFSVMFDLTPMFTTSCEITTKDASELIEFGKEPEIIPYGIGGCEASITGTFYNPNARYPNSKNASSIFPASSLAPEITSFDEMLKVFDRVDEQDIQYAVKLSPRNGGGTRELENGIWKIKKVSYERNAKEMGQYRFSILLSYFWEDKEEQMISKDSTGKNSRQTCEFEIYNYKGGIWVGPIYINNVTIQKSLHSKNTARFDATTPLTKDTLVKINLRRAINNGDKNIFYGIIIDSNASGDGLYTTNCVEIMDLMYRNVCTDPNGGPLAFLNPRIKIPTPLNGEDYTIQRMVKEMLNTYYKPKPGFEIWKPGEGIDKTGSLGSSIYLPGRHPDPITNKGGIKLSGQELSAMSIGTGLTNFLYHQCGFYTWINYNTGFFEYGFIRDIKSLDITKEIIVKTVLVSDNQDDMIADGVVVFESNAEYLGYDGDIGPDKNVLVYKLNDNKNDVSLSAIAHRILEYNKIEHKESYDVEFRAGTVRFNEGDIFDGLGDQTLPGDQKMEWRDGSDADPLEKPSDSSWQIKEMTITNEKTIIRVGTSYYSVLDIYKNSLNRERNGVAIPIEDVTIQCKNCQIGEIKL